MKGNLSRLLATTGGLSSKEMEWLEKELRLRTLHKGETLLKTDTVCDALYFIDSGALFRSRLDGDNQTIILDLRISGEWILDHQSFVTRTLSDSTIVAHSKSVLYELGLEAVHRLISKSPSFFSLGTILESSKARSTLLSTLDNPDEKYHYLLENRPELLQAFPLKMIASYLNMTPETLSRVRKRLF